MRRFLIYVAITIGVATLYIIEFNKIETDSNNLPTLDNIEINDVARNWDPFYHVRATIIDGQSAEVSIPEVLKSMEGKPLELQGGAKFFSLGCRQDGDSNIVTSLYLLPTLSLVDACNTLPDVEMRWTIRVNLKSEWRIKRVDMIEATVKVVGDLRIDSSKPYESIFFLDRANIELVEN